MTQTLIYTLHCPETKEFLDLGQGKGFVRVEDYQHAVKLHGVEQLNFFCREYPDAVNLLVKEHKVEISQDHKGTVKDLLNMSGIELPELYQGPTH